MRIPTLHFANLNLKRYKPVSEIYNQWWKNERKHDEWPFEDDDSENDNSRLNDEADAEQEPLDEVPVAERPVIQVIDVTAPVNPSSSTSTSILNWRRFRGNSRRNGSVLPV